MQNSEYWGNLMKNLGKHIKTAREKKMLTCGQMASVIGHSETFMKKIEAGEALPSVVSFYQILKFLEMKSFMELLNKDLIYDCFIGGRFNQIIEKGKLIDYSYKLLMKESLPYSPSIKPFFLNHVKTLCPLYRLYHGLNFIILCEGRLKISIIEPISGKKIELYLANPFDSLFFYSNPMYVSLVAEKGRTKSIFITNNITDAETPIIYSNHFVEHEINKLNIEEYLARLIGGRIKKILSGQMLKNLAKYIEVSNSYISRIIDGQTLPSLIILGKIADFLSVDIDALIAPPILRYNLFQEPQSFISSNDNDFLSYIALNRGILNGLPTNAINHIPYLVVHKREAEFGAYRGWEQIILKKGKLKIIFPDVQGCKKEIFLTKLFDQTFFYANVPHIYVPEASDTESMIVTTGLPKEFIK